jgi:hypothetical protein
MLINSVKQFNEALAYGPYAWPGGYPGFFITNDGGALCFDCAKADSASIIDSIATQCNDGWEVSAFDINWEDPDLTCDNCHDSIESAYSD